MSRDGICREQDRAMWRRDDAQRSEQHTRIHGRVADGCS